MKLAANASAYAAGNEQASSFAAQLLGGVLKRGGVWAFVAGCLFFAAGLAELVSGLGLKIPGEVVSGLLYMAWGFGMAAIGSAGWHAKRATDMIATTQAENKLENPHLEATSADPAVQRAIEKIQLSASGSQPRPDMAAK